MGSYVGWIPCVSGHLDFSRMDVGLHGVFMPRIRRGLKGVLTFPGFIGEEKDRKRESINFAATGFRDGHNRRVLLQSWVDWRDVEDGDGEARVVVCAEAKKSDNLDNRELTGYLLMYPRRYKKDFSEEHNALMEPVGKLSTLYKKSISARSTERIVLDEKLQSQMNELWSHINNKLSSSKPLGVDPNVNEHVYLTKFTINAHGLISISYVRTPGDEECEISEEEEFTVCRQAFYYLKYSLHRHKHHSERADAFTTIVKSKTLNELKKRNTKNAGLDEGLKLVGQLKRELTAIKRNQNITKSLDDTAPHGVIGYLKSLITACYSIKWIDKSVFDREKAWACALSESFDAQHTKIDKVSDSKNLSRQSSRQWVALVVTALSLLSIVWINLNAKTVEALDRKHGEIPFLLDWLNMSPNLFLVNIFIFMVAVYTLYLLIYKIINCFSERPSFLRVVYRQPWGYVFVRDVFLIFILFYIFMRL